MFGLKVQLADSTQGTKSPIRHIKRHSHSNIENVASSTSHLDDFNSQCPSAALDLNSCTSGSSLNWMPLSTAGEKPPTRFNHAATVVGSKMIVVGGESGREMLEDVQVLNFDKLTWTSAAPKLYLSPSSLPLKIPACKGHSLAARSGHTVTRAGSVLILFGGEDAKGRKLNDLHMFDLKSLTWLPLHCIGTGPSPRSNHVAALYDDKVLLIFGGAAKSRTLNDLYSLDFERMVWSRIKIRGFHPSPRAGCCGVLCGSKWYITGGGSRKKRVADTVVFDVPKVEWNAAVTAPPSSVTTNKKGFSLVLVQHKDQAFLVAFGGCKKEPSNQVEILIMGKNEQSIGRQAAPDKDLVFKNCSTVTGFASHLNNDVSQSRIESLARQNLVSAVEIRGSGRKSLSETSVDPNSVCGDISLRKQFHQEEEYSSGFRLQKVIEEDRHKEADDGSISNASSQGIEQRSKLLDAGVQVDIATSIANADETPIFFDSENSRISPKQVYSSLQLDNEDIILPETDGRSAALSIPSNIYQLYESRMAALVRKNGSLEGQLSAALANRETAEKNLSSATKSRQDVERKLADALKEADHLKEKLSAAEIAQEEANSLSNIVHSDNVRLEHDVAFLKAVLDDTQKIIRWVGYASHLHASALKAAFVPTELHSTRGVLAAERARGFQLQVPGNISWWKFVIKSKVIVGPTLESVTKINPLQTYIAFAVLVCRKQNVCRKKKSETFPSELETTLFT
ncbi:hypothetical protein ACLOJK_026088 [Asimina triloba]